MNYDSHSKHQSLLQDLIVYFYKGNPLCGILLAILGLVAFILGIISISIKNKITSIFGVICGSIGFLQIIFVWYRFILIASLGALFSFVGLILASVALGKINHKKSLNSSQPLPGFNSFSSQIDNQQIQQSIQQSIQQLLQNQQSKTASSQPVNQTIAQPGNENQPKN